MASISKRAQARNERELHDLLAVPGNSQCADCGAKNPAWASWNLGVFLCMRCASLHRKLGTHISKVKSLSMDTWSSDQVESMKRNGNNAVNKTYNPKNKKPDMPLDADEVDSAMERFIRKKYQEKSLSDGRPEPPQRDEPSRTTTYSRPQEQESPPPPLPPKKGKFFGFGLRASSSAYPLSKHDKKKLPKEPRVDSAFRISGSDYDSVSRMADARFEMTDAELQTKLATLRDMGFTDTDRNTSLLQRLNGNVERTIETLVQLGSRENGNSSSARKQKETEQPTRQSSAPTSSAPEPSYNPFTQMTNQQTAGLSLTKPQDPSTPTSTQGYGSANPYNQQVRGSTEPTGLEQSFQSMQLAQPLFPNSTGGYPAQPALHQDPRFQYSMTPPVQPTQFQQGYTASPAAIAMNTNPFFQPPNLSAQSTGTTNPFLAQVPPSPSTNPFLGTQAAQTPQKQQSLPPTFNPFGIPPSQSPPQTAQPQQYQTQDLFGATSPSHFTTPQQSTNPFQSQPMPQQLLQPANPLLTQPPVQFPNFQYAQPQPQTQPQFQQQTLPPQPQPLYQQQQTGSQIQPMMPQQTGRYDKTSIMALYNYPQMGPQQLSSIPEPASEGLGAQQQMAFPQQQLSPAPSGDIFGGYPNQISPARRSATMPVSLSHMHSAGGSGNRNPFMTNASLHPNFDASLNPAFPGAGAMGNASTNPFGPAAARAQGMAAAPGVSPGQGIMARHTSSESVSINNLDAGRHSPDAFANLSARYMR